MTPAGSASCIFVVSSTEDSEFGKRLVQDLRYLLGDARAVHYDWQDSDDAARRKSKEELTVCPVFIVIVSPAALASPRVKALANLAWRQRTKKFIFPVICHSYQQIPADFNLDLEAIQAIIFLSPKSYEAALTEVLRAVLRALGLLTDRKIQKRIDKLVSSTREPADSLAGHIQQMILQIKEAFGKEDWDTVKRKAEYLLGQDQTAMNPELYRMQGRALREVGEIEAAQLAFDNANRISEQGIAQANTYYSKTKRYKKALDACNHVISADPEYDPAYSLKSLALYQLKQYTEALATCEQAIRLDPNLAVAHNNKGLGQSNVIAVVANGDTLNLYVNNQKIDSIHDSTSSSGLIGFSAADTGEPTEVVYSYAKVWTF